jgi:hypothetical protein
LSFDKKFLAGCQIGHHTAPAQRPLFSKNVRLSELITVTQAVQASLHVFSPVTAKQVNADLSAFMSAAAIRTG